MLNENFDSVSKDTITFVDIDETVFSTKAKVYVRKDGKIIAKLNNREYNSHELSAGESYDFSEFRNSDIFYRTSTPIKTIIGRVAKLINSGHRVIFLTARADFDDKRLFLQKFMEHEMHVRRSNVCVERAGNTPGSTHEVKKSIVNKYLSGGKYKAAQLIDDHRKNLVSFLELKRDYPDIKFQAWVAGKKGILIRMKDNLDEVLSVAARLKKARTMKRLAPKIARMRKIKMKRKASQAVLKTRSHRDATKFLKARLAPGKDLKAMTPQQKIALEKRLKAKKKLIPQIAKRMLKNVKTRERERLARR